VKKLVKVKFKNEYAEKLDYNRSNDRDHFDIKTIFFIIDIDFFINNFKYVTNEMDYTSISRAKKNVIMVM
jgi:hypothetical protein